jgi:hypothetical protein
MILNPKATKQRRLADSNAGRALSAQMRAPQLQAGACPLGTSCECLETSPGAHSWGRVLAVGRS